MAELRILLRRLLINVLHLALLLGAGLAGLAYHNSPEYLIPCPYRVRADDTRECLTPPDRQAACLCRERDLDRAFTADSMPAGDDLYGIEKPRFKQVLSCI